MDLRPLVFLLLQVFIPSALELEASCALDVSLKARCCHEAQACTVYGDGGSVCFYSSCFYVVPFPAGRCFVRCSTSWKHVARKLAAATVCRRGLAYIRIDVAKGRGTVPGRRPPG